MRDRKLFHTSPPVHTRSIWIPWLKRDKIRTDTCLFVDWKSSRRKKYFGHKCKIWRGQWVKNLNMESKILCPRHLLGASASIFMIAVICHKFVIVYKPMRTETGLAKCLNLIFFFLTFFFHVVFFFLWLLSGEKKAIPEIGWVFNVVR